MSNPNQEKTATQTNAQAGTQNSHINPNWQADYLDLAQDYGEQTMSVRAGHHRTDEGEHSEAIFTTSSYVYKNAEDAFNHFNGSSKGNVYSRHTNPTVRTFERRLSAMENGERAVATATGMGAILTMCLAYLQSGDHIIVARQIFGSTMGLINNFMGKFGVTATYVDGTDHQAWADAIQQNTKLLFCESPSNPLGQICDIAYLAELAHTHNALFVVDNCFATPAIQKPLTMGADIVIHSATKYLDGQGRVLGGALVGSHELMEKAFGVVRSCGISMSPFNAWVFLKGLETLKIRMQAHCENGMKVAEWLHHHPNVTKVHFAGLSEHPQHELAKRQHTSGLFGAVLGFEVMGGNEDSNENNETMQANAWAVIDNTQMISISNNLGDTKTIITHPATTTHYRMGAEARSTAGVKESLIRLSVGIEDVEDIIADLARGLDVLGLMYANIK